MKNIYCMLRGKRFAAKTWHTQTNPPLLALHGWLDNAGSFDRLAPHLGKFFVIAPDLAGHGLSEHRSPDSGYNLWQDVGDMKELIEQLKLDPVVLVGHSRGAMIGTMLAAVYPEKIRAMVLLDGFMPEPISIDDTVSQLRRAFDDRRKYLHKEPRYYKSYEDAIKNRLKGPLKLSRNAADTIATRGLADSTKGYYWRTDPRLRAASEFKLTAEHSLTFVEHLKTPTMLLMSLSGNRFFNRLIAANNRIQTQAVEGSHHFHLEDTALEVANGINQFLLSVGISAGNK